MDNTILRTVVRDAYDVQALRLAAGGRVTQYFYAQLAEAVADLPTDPDAPDDDAPEDAPPAVKAFLLRLQRDYKRVTDGMAAAAKHRTFPAGDIIRSPEEYVLAEHYFDLLASETRQFKRLKGLLERVPLYGAFLKGIRGIGPAMAGVLLSEIKIERATYPSSLWALAGLDVGPDGRGRSRRAEHLIDRPYQDREGNEQTKKSLTYNPWLKTKLMGVLAASFLRAGNARYSDIYRDYKHRLESRPDWAARTKAHRHQAALRYMIKMFLRDLYIVWRTLEGLPVAPDYAQSKLGMPPHRAAA